MEQEAKLKQKLEATRTATDRELCDIRRQLAKMEDSKEELAESLEQKHAEEISTIPQFLPTVFRITLS